MKLVKNIITSKEVAQILGVSRYTVCEIVKTTDIPHWWAGPKSLRFDRAAVIEWKERGGSKRRAA
jgi:excisionase family DNA binding protein